MQSTRAQPLFSALIHIRSNMKLCSICIRVHTCIYMMCIINKQLCTVLHYSHYVHVYVHVTHLNKDIYHNDRTYISHT